MRDMQKEAWFLYYVTSIPHFEKCAQACEDFADLFNQLITGHGVHGYGKLDYWVQKYIDYAKEIRDRIDMVRYSGDYMPIRESLNAAFTDYRGIAEQMPFGWMGEGEKNTWGASFDKLSTLCALSAEVLRNNLWKGSNWLNKSQSDRKILDRDDGIVGGKLEYFESQQKLGLFPTPEAYTQFKVDNTVSCQAGETCPWTGVWIPQQAIDEGLEKFSLAFALKGRPIQPAYRIVEDYMKPFSNNPLSTVKTRVIVTKAEDAIWHPVVAVKEHDRVSDTATSQRVRAEANTPCPRAGFWWTPAKNDSRRRFEQGEIMPDFPSSQYGLTIWYWDAE